MRSTECSKIFPDYIEDSEERNFGMNLKKEDTQVVCSINVDASNKNITESEDDNRPPLCSMCENMPKYPKCMSDDVKLRGYHSVFGIDNFDDVTECLNYSPAYFEVNDR